LNPVLTTGPEDRHTAGSLSVADNAADHPLRCGGPPVRAAVRS